MPVGRIADVLSDMVYGATSINDFTGPSTPAEVQARDIFDLPFHGTLVRGEPPPQRRGIGHSGP